MKYKLSLVSILALSPQISVALTPAPTPKQLLFDLFEAAVVIALPIVLVVSIYFANYYLKNCPKPKKYLVYFVWIFTILFFTTLLVGFLDYLG